MKNKITSQIQIAVLLIFMILLETTAFYLDSQDNQKNIVAAAGIGIPDEQGTVSGGGFSYGLYNFENKLYDNSDNLAAITDGTFSAVYSFEQEELSGIRDYILIIMVDFKQTEFEVNGKTYRNYRFSLEDESKCEIEFKLSNLPEDAYEMQYLVFFDPDCTNLSFSDEGWDNIMNTNDVCINRLRFSSSKKPSDNLRYIEGTQMTLEEDQSYDGVSISRYKSNITILAKAESGKKVYLFIGNYHEEDTDFTAVAFCNWEQVNILPEEDNFYVKLPPHTPNYYEFYLPKVQEDSPYQIVTFDQPFGNEEYPDSSASDRTIIKGEKATQ